MEAPFAVRLFGGDAPATGEDAQLTIWSGHVELRSARVTERVPLTQLRVREVVSAQRGLELAWDSRGRQFAAHLFDPAAVQRLQSHPLLQGVPQLASLRSRQRRSGVVRTVVLALLGVLVLLPLLLVLVFIWQADRIAGAIAARIPVAQEEQLGRKVFERMRDRLKLQEQGADVEQVRELGRRLTAGSHFSYEFHVAEDPTVNAFAMPGGVIVVHTGLLRAVRRPEELAGVLAHEIQHVELRHSLRALVRELGMRGAWAALTGDVGTTLAGEAALKLTSLRFSRDAELQADAGGFDVLLAHDIDPAGMVDFFATLEKAAGAGPPAWLSTHPASEARAQALRVRQEALGARRFTPLALSP